MDDSSASVACLALVRRYREGVYGCFTRSRDALFELAEALLVAWWVQSFVGLSQVPEFRRQWPSVYAALRDGQVDRAGLQRVFVQHAPLPETDGYLVVAVDSTPYPRPYAHTSPDRTQVHVPGEGLVLPRGAALVKPGWQFSIVAVVPKAASSFTSILDNQRIPSTQTPIQTALTQVAALSTELKTQRPTIKLLCLLDAGYATTTWVAGLAVLATPTAAYPAPAATPTVKELTLAAAPAQQPFPISCLVRAPANRVLYRAAPPPTGKKGRPRLHGDPFQGKKTETHGTPDATWAGVDAAGKGSTVRCWANLHLKKVPEVAITVVCITRAAATGTTRDPTHTWFWWIGDPLPPLPELAFLYERRYRVEHGIRFDKQDLLWLDPKLRTPERAQMWTDVVSAVHNQLTLSRDLVEVKRLPWEDPERPCTPGQVRRGMPKIIAQLGTPARPPRPRGYSPGRTPGTPVRKAQRHNVIRKGTKRQRKRAS
jgi:DDE superfamily endonuclease